MKKQQLLQTRIRSLESRVAKIEKSGASAKNSIPIRLDSSSLPHGEVLVRTWHISDYSIGEQCRLFEPRAWHDSSLATLRDLKVLGPEAVRCFVTCHGCALIAVA